MKNVILVGFMGSGKSTLGLKLAKKLDYQFLDSDKEIEKQSGLSVGEIFEQFGESHFRKLEHDFLLQIQSRQNIVLSTGGGMPCFHSNMELLKLLGTSFYLKLSAIELSRRLLNAKSPRPLIQNKTKEELISFVQGKLSERSFFYEQAEFTLSGKEQNVPKIIDLLR